MRKELPSAAPVVVIGAGLAGLAAGIAAGQAGRPPVILDTRSPGGRARTEIRDGFRLNQGPHALYRGGPGRAVLERFGVRPAGHSLPFRGARLRAGGQLAGPMSSRVLGLRAQGQLARVLARLARQDAGRWEGRSASDWVSTLGLCQNARLFIEAYLRTVTFVASLDRLPAELAIAQARSSLHGVSYLDGGWQRLADALLSRAVTAGARVLGHTPAEAITGGPDAWQVHTSAGMIRAAAVVVAAGTPAAARRLLPADPGWGELGPEVTAACLDLGLRRPGVPLVLGLDEPLYLSPHAPPGDLAPPGRGLVHVIRYEPATAPADRSMLWEFAGAAGISDADVVTSRFLPRMMVASTLPPPGRGLSGRPPVPVPGIPGVFLAGDWVGPQGWLSDTSLLSGQQAGTMAAEAVRTAHRTHPVPSSSARAPGGQPPAGPGAHRPR